MPELDFTCQLCLLHFTTRSTLLHCENSFFQRTAFHRCKLERPTEVSDCIIWFLWEWIWSGYQISLTTIKQQLAYVYLQIALNVAQHKCPILCPTQVPSASAQWRQWCPTVVTRADRPGPAEDLTWLAGGRIGAWWDIFGRSVLPHLTHGGFGCTTNIAMWIGITQICLN